MTGEHIAESDHPILQKLLGIKGYMIFLSFRISFLIVRTIDSNARLGSRFKNRAPLVGVCSIDREYL
jgi:hypothetical protein